MKGKPMASSMDEILSMMVKARGEAAKRIQSNKHILFDAFDANGVTGAEVRFDGSGDSGGIEGIDLVTDKDANAILTKVVEGGKILEYTQFGPDGTKEVYNNNPATVNDLIESICYDALKAEHEGWENNDGAYGDIHFDSETRSVTMNFYERSTEYHEHEF
jgi:hypothetical protein